MKRLTNNETMSFEGVFVLLAISNLPNSENGRLRRDRDIVPNQTQKFFNLTSTGFRFILKRGFQLKDEFGA